MFHSQCASLRFHHEDDDDEDRKGVRQHPFEDRVHLTVYILRDGCPELCLYQAEEAPALRVVREDELGDAESDKEDGEDEEETDELFRHERHRR